MGDSAFAVVKEVEESSDFGEGQRDEASVYGLRGVWFGFLGWCVVPV
ncbi:MAG: hypothetical protein LC700_03635 [Actinobacteria bacterium]|nr:hypothetical protein [Actinomycetota bacterium]